MDFLDLSLQKECLHQAYGNLTARVKSLASFCGGLQQNLARAAMHFNSANFQRASQITAATQQDLDGLLERIKSLKGYFDELEKCCNDYINCKY